MLPIPSIAIVDVGKTNKKLLVYDQYYTVIHQLVQSIPETQDEDGFPSEDLRQLSATVLDLVDSVLSDKRFDIKAINFTAYGASLVYLDKNGDFLPILYNYLKPYPDYLLEEFHRIHGSTEKIALETASPSLGNLNSGMQLYWIKSQKPELFAKIHTALHLPQFISYLFTQKTYSEKTSIGCHTQLWDFRSNTYHKWVLHEKLDTLFPAILDSSSFFDVNRNGKEYKIGLGLHDSSSALIPYMLFFKNPFVLISTGTWSISLNPFNHEPLTVEELNHDCLCYIQSNGKPVKAARFFIGQMHDRGVERIASHFALPHDFYISLKYDRDIQDRFVELEISRKPLDFANLDLLEISSPDMAYYILMNSLVELQLKSTSLILGSCDPEYILIDGGFSQNEIYIQLLREKFINKRIFVSTLSQSTSLGAALILHDQWNETDLSDIVFPIREVSGH